MSRSLRVAILGAGRMAVNHAAAIKLQRDARLVAIADPYANREDVAERFGNEPILYQDVTQLLEEVRPDVIHVVTPPDTHVELTRTCLEAGAHVYVEKPFAPTVREAKMLLDLAAEKGLKLCAAHQVLFQHAGRRYKDYLHIIGDVVHVESYFSFKPTRRRADGGASSSHVEQLVDILPHPVYLMLSGLERGQHPKLIASEVSPNGEVRALVRSNDSLGTLIVTLRGRPIESYLRVVGTNGAIAADFVLGGTVKLLGPGASAPSVVIKPFSQACQIALSSFAGLARLLFRRHKSYPGLAELLTRFYDSIRSNEFPPVAGDAILQTVGICEAISEKLRDADALAEQNAERRLSEVASRLPSIDGSHGVTLVTGGSGFLGRGVLAELRATGHMVRAVARRIPRAGQRVAGIEYVEADLGREIPSTAFDGVRTVVHLAAETAGNKQAHERNTIEATRNLLDAMERAHVRRLVNISSVAVMLPSARGGVLDEQAPLDRNNLARGPYVWAKAEAEALVRERLEIDVRTLRLGPLVDMANFSPPGRLGREVARLFVAVGSRSSAMSVCDIHTAAAVIRDYVDDFESAPRCVNLIEVPAPTRGQLAQHLAKTRPDLRFLWLPFPLLRIMSSFTVLLQRVVRPHSPALNLYAAFKGERYDPALAQRVIEKARQARAHVAEGEATSSEHLSAAS